MYMYGLALHNFNKNLNLVFSNSLLMPLALVLSFLLTYVASYKVDVFRNKCQILTAKNCSYFYRHLEIALNDTDFLFLTGNTGEPLEKKTQTLEKDKRHFWSFKMGSLIDSIYCKKATGCR